MAASPALEDDVMPDPPDRVPESGIAPDPAMKMPAVTVTGERSPDASGGTTRKMLWLAIAVVGAGIVIGAVITMLIR